LTDDEFFDATDELKIIKAWARARYAAPWAVFGAVLLRVAASVGPHVQLPGLIGGRASLNLLCAFVSASGGGKGISDKVARLAWPAPIIERPIGSGEGIAATFVPPKKEGVEPITAAIFSVPEIDTLTGIATRQGSILLAQLKSMAMGELLGQSNASEATTRIIPAHSYRCCLSVGAQPGHCDVVFNDTTGGTPQRFLWFPTTDPDMPAERTEDPQPLNTNIPYWTPADGIVEIGYGPAEITDTVIAAHLARQRGESDALDGHRLLTRCKVAAVIAIMHHRSVVSDTDWALSDTVMTMSDQTRDWIVEQARQAARAKVRERAVARAAGEDFYDASRLQTVKNSILRMLERDGEQASNKLRSRLGKREKRDLFEQAVALLEADGLICERIDEYNGATRVRYRIGSGLTNEVSPQNPSSGGVTHQVRPDLSATVTDLDSRRSPDPRQSARQWLNEHIAALRDTGITTAESFAVFAAGQEAGFPIEALRTAASRHPDVKVVNRTPRTSIWDISGTRPETYRPATAWVQDYITALPAGSTEIDRDAFKAAALAAGYTWTAARHAALNHPRVESAPAEGDSTVKRIWLLKTQAEPGEGEAS
jgi:hypothetical protein